MTTREIILAALGVVVLTTAVAAQSADDKSRLDFAPIVPPVFPLPPSSSITPGVVGTPQQSPYTTAPLQDPARSYREPAPAPGLRLNIPTR